MKSDTRLDAAVFQLTPTRTRCDFVISANGASEKIATGLLNPFLAHLKTAREQIAKGGYTITLQPNAGAAAPWFTKGTLERFVRFVSTPEILERADTIESEILQICEAIDIQSNDQFYPNSVEEDQSESGSAIVLYQPGIHPEPGGRWKPSPVESKEHFFRVLESRKLMLHCEQGMAFARAAAAGFDAENVADLISFAQCFGAKRMLKACIRFDELWRRKKEIGQRLEIDFHESEAMSMRSDFPSLSSLDVLLSPDVAKRDWAASNRENSTEKRSEVPGWSSQMPFCPYYPHVLSHYPHHVLHPHSLHASFLPYPPQCSTNHHEPRSTVDRRPGHEVDDGRNGRLDLMNGRQGSGSAGKPLRDESSSEPCTPSESASRDRDPSDEDEQEVNRSEEVDADVNWWIPDILLPRNGRDHDYERDKVDPVEGTTPPGNWVKLQKSRCDEDDPSLAMLHRGKERESDAYDPIKDDSEAMIKSSVVAEKGANKRANEENKRLGSAWREKTNKSKLSPLADAQARANKLRALKADFQKTKKKKGQEEEEQRRLETLKKERERRIAARSSSSPVTPNQRTSRPPTKRTSPSLTFPSTIDMPGRTERKREVVAGTRLTRSLSSLPDMAKRKEEALGAASQPKKTSRVPRRMSEPREIFGQRLSSSLQSTATHSQIPSKCSVSNTGNGRRLSFPLRSAVKSGQTPPHNSFASGGRSKSVINFSQTSQQKSSASIGTNGQRVSSLRTTLQCSSGKSPTQTSSASNHSSARRLPSASGKTPPTPPISARSKSTGKSALTSGNKKAIVRMKTVKNEWDDAGVDVAEMGNRFPQIEATPPLNESQPIVQEETQIVAPAKESQGKSVRFSLTDKPFLGDQHHRRAASMEETCSSQNPKFGDIRCVDSATSRAKERETFKGLKKLFKFGRKTSGDSGLETSSLRSEDLTSTISSSPAAQKASRRFSILSSFRSKKSTAS